MTTDWINRVYVIVRVGIQSAANQLAQQIGIGGSDSDEVFGAVELSVLGQGEPTDFGCSTLMTPPIYEELKTAAELPAFASLQYYCVDAERGTLIESNSPDGGGFIGDIWGWQQSLDDMGLRRIVGELHSQDTP